MFRSSVLGFFVLAAVTAANLSAVTAGPVGSGGTGSGGTNGGSDSGTESESGATKSPKAEKVPGGTIKDKPEPKIVCTETGTKDGVRGTLDCKPK